MNFAYLNLKNHPRGNVILRELVQQGFVPSIIIEEDSVLAQKSIANFATIKNLPTDFFPTSAQDIIANFNIPLAHVANHNDENCENLLKRFAPDLIVLGDVRIIKKNIRDIPTIGTINSHPGYLPDVRGNNPYIWAIIHDLPQGCSIHFIDENIDTGDILLREEIPAKTYKSYPDLLQKINNLCAELMVKALRQIVAKEHNPLNQTTLEFIRENYSKTIGEGTKY